MMSIRKLTEYSRAHIKANTTMRRLPSISPSTVYQPKSRFEKIRSSGLVYPKSTPTKIVFVSNSYGNGFRNERNIEFPPQIDIQQMKQEVDRVCYKKWKENKDSVQRQTLEEFNSGIKILCGVAVSVIVVLFFTVVGQHNWEKFIEALVWMSLIFTVGCMVLTIAIYMQEKVDVDFDRGIISAVKQRLAELNAVEMEGDEPRFQWSCSRECVWIAIELYGEE